MKYKITGIMVLLLLVVIFTLQNTEIVSLQFLLWNFSLSRALMFFLILTIGILVGFFAATMQRKDHDEHSVKPGKTEL